MQYNAIQHTTPQELRMREVLYGSIDDFLIYLSVLYD